MRYIFILLMSMCAVLDLYNYNFLCFLHGCICILVQSMVNSENKLQFISSWSFLT